MRFPYPAILLFALTACESSPPGLGLAPRDSGADSTTPDAGVVADAAGDSTTPIADSEPAADADASDGRGHNQNDQPSDPGTTKCGGLSCATASHYCCVDTTDGGPATCLDNGVSACGGIRQKCDEAADCPTANICCINAGDAASIADNTVCVTACDADGFQVCRTDAECKNGLLCVGQMCNGIWIQTCGHLPEMRCP